MAGPRTFAYQRWFWPAVGGFLCLLGCSTVPQGVVEQPISRSTNAPEPLPVTNGGLVLSLPSEVEYSTQTNSKVAKIDSFRFVAVQDGKMVVNAQVPPKSETRFIGLPTGPLTLNLSALDKHKTILGYASTTVIVVDQQVVQATLNLVML